MRPDELSALTDPARLKSRPVRRRLFSEPCDQKVIVEYINQTPSLPVQLVTDFDESNDNSIYCDVIVDSFDDSEQDDGLSSDADENSSPSGHLRSSAEKESTSLSGEEEESPCKDWDSVNGSQETFSEFNGFHDYCINLNKMDDSVGTGRDMSDDDRDDVENLDWLLDFSLDSVLNFRPKEKFLLQKSNDINKTPEILNPRHTCSSSKPPYNYGELIQLALKEKGQLTVDDIYNWIRLKFPYYRFQDDKRWKAGIRHKLSTHSAFVKTSKSATKRGHLWSYVMKDSGSKNMHAANKNHWKKQKIADYKNDVREEYARLAGRNASKPDHISKATYPSRSRPYPPVAKLASPAPTTFVIDEQTMKQYSSHSDSKLSSKSTNQARSPHGELEVTSEERAVIQQAFSLLQVPGSPTQMCKLLHPKQNVTYAYLLPNAAFLNPVSPGQVMKESGLMDDPPSAKTILSLPSYSINAGDALASQELFDGALKVHHRSNTPTIAS